MAEDDHLAPRAMDVLDALGEGITILDADGEIVDANRAAVEILRLEESELTSRSYRAPAWDISSIDGRPLSPDELPAARALTEGRAVWNERIVVDRPDAPSVLLSVNAVPIRDGAGKVRKVVVSFRDLTEQQEAERRFQRLFRESPVAIAIVSADGELVEANQALADMLGYERAALEGLSFTDFTHPEDVEKDREKARKVVAGEIDGYQIQKRYVTRDGNVVWADLRVAALRDQGDGTLRLVGFARDITERKRFEEALERARDKFEGIFNVSPVALKIVRAETDVYLEVNRTFEDIFGYGRDEILAGDVATDALWETPADRERIYARLQGGDTVRNEEVRFQRKDGSVFDGLFSAALLDRGGEQLLVGAIQDISSLKEVERQLEHRSLHDPLTGLANRVLLSDRVEQGLARARRHGQPLGLLMLDLDDFKRVNDRLGHTAGDRVLTEFSRRLRDVLRDPDTVARWGGDEFVVLLPELEEPEGIIEVCERIRDAVRAPIEAGGEAVHVDVTIGAVVRSEAGDRGAVQTEEPDELIRFGSLALHWAKDESPAGFKLFDPGETVEGAAQIRRERELREAIEAGEIVPHYQPVVRLENGSLVGVEALARWQHPERGLVPPSEFIPLAEELGLIGALDEAVLQQGCREAARWEAAGADGSPVPISFNLSGQQFRGRELAERLERRVMEAGLRPEQVIFEVTETSLMRVPMTIERIRSRGFQVYVDDFGTGYSSFAYLRDLELDGLKVDMSFVQGIAASRSDAAIVESMITLGRRLGLTVVAEGIEADEQRQTLLGLGCGLGQGYLFARPMPGEEMSAGWLRGGGTAT